MMGRKMGGEIILERKTSATCLERQGGRVCKTKDQMYTDESRENYKGTRGDTFYEIKMFDGCVNGYG